jgi:3-oxoacyl-[acyl-carrier protein] reductase
MDLELTGKRALVTGGTRGIGRQITLALATAGVSVITCGRQEGAAAESLAAELASTGGDHHVMRADVSRPEDVDKLAAEARGHFGGLDVIVHNAGVISHVPAGELNPAEWARVVDTNLTAAYLVVQRTLPLLGGGASVIGIGSRVATAGMAAVAHYSAAKQGLVGLCRSLARELGPRGVRVNVIAPGLIETPETAARMSEQQREAYWERYRPMLSLGRFGYPADIANAVMFLASDLSSYITGQTITVDGGI